MAHLLKALKVENNSGTPQRVMLRRIRGNVPLQEYGVLPGPALHIVFLPGSEIVALHEKSEIGFEASSGDMIVTPYWDDDIVPRG